MKKNLRFARRQLPKRIQKLKCGLLFGLLWAMLFVVPAAAQSKTITGKITDENNQPLEGVSIGVKGTNAGTSSNADGQFTINVTGGHAVLVFSNVGYADKEVVVGNSMVINVTLQKDIAGLNEVVVVAYGTQKKTNMTGAVSSISSSQLERRPNVSTSAALQGLAPGVTVTSQTGAPGGDGAQIRIRGINSFGGSSSNPLVIIDGVAGNIDDIDFNLIESISVLKDAASAAIYGSRAANG
ncbi:MAG: TonB-dependent receptor plug domain-containing protein, partial [Chitinophagaceae bacterium]|nr:TonB-dependent receptor plug domain-containing protein [Chitinophagaceae bacterium]